MEKILLDRQDIAEATGFGLSTIDTAVSRGDLETFLVGRKRKATREAVQKFLTFLKKQSDAGRPVCYRARSAERKVVRKTGAK